MKDMQKHKGILREVANLLKKYESFNKVAVSIYGKIVYLTEREVRALEVIAMQKQQEGEDSFKEFCDNVIVYRWQTKKNSNVSMIFSKEGGFENKFPRGFYDVCGALHLIVLREKRKKQGKINIS